MFYLLPLSFSLSLSLTLSLSLSFTSKEEFTFREDAAHPFTQRSHRNRSIKTEEGFFNKNGPFTFEPKVPVNQGNQGTHGKIITGVAPGTTPISGCDPKTN
jgi:hypothetical protein